MCHTVRSTGRKNSRGLRAGWSREKRRIFVDLQEHGEIFFVSSLGQRLDEPYRQETAPAASPACWRSPVTGDRLPPSATSDRWRLSGWPAASAGVSGQLLRREAITSAGEAAEGSSPFPSHFLLGRRFICGVGPGRVILALQRRVNAAVRLRAVASRTMRCDEDRSAPSAGSVPWHCACAPTQFSSQGNHVLIVHSREKSK